MKLFFENKTIFKVRISVNDKTFWIPAKETISIEHYLPRKIRASIPFITPSRQITIDNEETGKNEIYFEINHFDKRMLLFVLGGLVLCTLIWYFSETFKSWIYLNKLPLIFLLSFFLSIRLEKIDSRN